MKKNPLLHCRLTYYADNHETKENKMNNTPQVSFRKPASSSRVAPPLNIADLISNVLT